MIVVLAVWENGFGQTSARLIEDDDGHTKYFKSIEDANENIDYRFPAKFVFIDIDSCEIVDL